MSQWLQAHPGVAVICRDRAGAYAEGARSGAPDAVQVADRFHLLRNVADAVQLVFAQHRKALKTVITVPPTSMASVETPGTGEVARKQEMLTLPISVPTAAEVAPPPSQPRSERYEQVCRLAEQGWPFTAIAKAVGLHRKTVSLYVRGRFPLGGPRAVFSIRTSLISLLAGTRAIGRNALWQEIQQQGYRGKRTTVLRYIGQLRKPLASRHEHGRLKSPRLLQIRVWGADAAPSHVARVSAS